MEEKLFYAYLKYQKDIGRKAWSNLLKIHWSVLLPFVVSIAATASTLTLTFMSPLCPWHWISVAVMLLAYILLMHTSENFHIKRSHEKFLDYCEYCCKMKTWLKGFSIDNKDKLASIKKRILIKISTLKNDHKKNTEGFNKWLQGFATPIVLAIITAVIAGENATEEKLAMTVVIIMIFVLTWYLCSIGTKMLNYGRTRRIEQLECFASDLQGILDTQFEDGIAYQRSKTHEGGQKSNHKRR